MQTLINWWIILSLFLCLFNPFLAKVSSFFTARFLEWNVNALPMASTVSKNSWTTSDIAVSSKIYFMHAFVVYPKERKRQKTEKSKKKFYGRYNCEAYSTILSRPHLTKISFKICLALKRAKKTEEKVNIRFSFRFFIRAVLAFTVFLFLETKSPFLKWKT